MFFLAMGLAGAPLTASSLDTPLVEGQTFSNFSQPTRTELRFYNIVVTLKDGRQLYGLFIAAESDALIIKVGKEEKRIPRTEIQRLSLEAPSPRSSLIAHGAVLGIYGGTLLAYRQNHVYEGDTPFAYIHGDSLWGWLLFGVEFAAIGGGLGYLASLFWSREAVFNFQRPEGKAIEEWERLRRYAAGASSGPYRFHITIQGGNVFFGPRDTYNRILRESGLKYYDYGNPASFNMMRQIRLTVSTSKWLDVGAAVFLLSEPGVQNSSYSYPDANTRIYTYVDETLSLTGYFAVAAMRYPPIYQKSLSLTAGLGLGAERIDFNLKTSYQRFYSWQPVATQENDVHVRKTALAGVAFAEATVSLGSGLSLGLAADYVFGPPHSLLSQPDVGIPAHKIRFSNGSVGLSLGYHF